MDAKDGKGFFESVAGEWDEMRAAFYNTSVIDALGEHADMDAEDVTAGLSARAKSVIGVDNSPAMLAVAADNLGALDLDDIALIDGALDRLLLQNDSADASSADMVFHHAEHPPPCSSRCAAWSDPSALSP
jgi:ubiquinone/menaquinone biosynthesis C-methylase UbiE